MTNGTLETRGFTTVAIAEELAQRPELLMAYAARFGDDDDATLAIYASSATDPDQLAAVVGPVLAAAGLDGEAGPDMLALPATPSANHLLGRHADAVLSGLFLGGPMGLLPRFDLGTVDDLRTLAEHEWDGTPAPAGIGGLRVSTPGGEMIVSPDTACFFVGGEYYERNVIAWTDAVVGALGAPVIVDIGANIGYYAVRYGRAAAAIHAFEPMPETADLCALNVARNGLDDTVTVHRIAVGAEEGEAVLRCYTSSANNSLWARDLPETHDVRLEREVPVAVRPLDALDLPAPDVIKIDTEGNELAVLRGARGVIAEHHPWLLLECEAPTCRDAGHTQADVVAEIRQHGYEIWGLSSNINDLRLRPVGDEPGPDVANLICVPPGASLPTSG